MQKLILFLFLSFGFTSLSAQEVKTSESQPVDFLKLKEYYRYKVFFGPFTLGFIEIFPSTDTTYQGQNAQISKIIMKSNPKLWFVGNKEEHFYTVYNRPHKDVMGLTYWKDDIDSKIAKEIIMTASPKDSSVFVEMKQKKKKTQYFILPWEYEGLLGPDIFFYSRFLANKDTTVNTTIYVDSLKEMVTMKYVTNKSKRLYEAFEDSIETTQMFGSAPFQGPFGFNGKFKSWYSSDELSIPLEAHADVWIGAIKVKLLEYKKIK